MLVFGGESIRANSIVDFNLFVGRRLFPGFNCAKYDAHFARHGGGDNNRHRQILH